MEVQMFTLQDLATLNSAIATGARSVYYGDKRVEYRSLQDMLTIQRMVMQNLGLLDPAEETRLAVFDKGFGSVNSRQPGSTDFDDRDPSFNIYL